jgi:two-component system sensor histidine kinase AtoS
MSLASRLPRLSFLGRRGLDLAEIEGLLDLYSQAALLIDLQLNRILLANAKATELTAFTRAEFADMDLSAFFPHLRHVDFSLEPDQVEKAFAANCLAHNGNQLEVIITLYPLNAPGSWLLASIEPAVIHELQQSERQRHSQRLEDLQALAQACQEQNLDRALETALESGHKLTGASHLAIYLYEPRAPKISCRIAWGDAQELPEQIAPSDLNTFLSAALWIPGKRPSTTLHRKARAMGFNYLASAPLGERGAFVGLIIAADKNVTPPPDLMAILRVLAANVTSIIQHYNLTTNLLQEQERQLQTITTGNIIKDNIKENVIVLGPDLRILEMNASTEYTLGYTCRDVCGSPIEEIVIGAENLVPALQAAQRGVPTHNLGNVRLHRRDGDTFLAHVQVLPAESKPDPERIIILIRDLSEHEQYQVRNQQLEQRALLGEVTAIFAHEVRNQINSISTGLQLMTMNLPEEDANQELITRLGGELNRINHLMTSALAFSRPVQNTMVPVDMAILTGRLLERFRPRFDRQGIQFHIQVSTEHPIVLGDSRTLEQVFTNLFTNAVDAMSEKGGTLTVHIRTVRDAAGRDQVETSVSDSGPGIPEEDQDRIFDPFFSTSRNGTGLGLAIAKRIVTAHKGTISVNSVPGGTVFQVVLPATIKRHE